MEMVALVLAGIVTVAVIQQQKRSMQRLIESREQKPDVRVRGRRRQ